jgi:hypothetical protein
MKVFNSLKEIAKKYVYESKIIKEIEDLDYDYTSKEYILFLGFFKNFFNENKSINYFKNICYNFGIINIEELFNNLFNNNLNNSKYNIKIIEEIYKNKFDMLSLIFTEKETNLTNRKLFERNLYKCIAKYI